MAKFNTGAVKDAVGGSVKESVLGDNKVTFEQALGNPDYDITDLVRLAPDESNKSEAELLIEANPRLFQEQKKKLVDGQVAIANSADAAANYRESIGQAAEKLNEDTTEKLQKSSAEQADKLAKNNPTGAATTTTRQNAPSLNGETTKKEEEKKNGFMDNLMKGLSYVPDLAGMAATTITPVLGGQYLSKVTNGKFTPEAGAAIVDAATGQALASTTSSLLRGDFVGAFGGVATMSKQLLPVADAVSGTLLSDATGGLFEGTASQITGGVWNMLSKQGPTKLKDVTHSLLEGDFIPDLAKTTMNKLNTMDYKDLMGGINFGNVLSFKNGMSMGMVKSAAKNGDMTSVASFVDNMIGNEPTSLFAWDVKSSKNIPLDKGSLTSAARAYDMVVGRPKTRQIDSYMIENLLKKEDPKPPKPDIKSVNAAGTDPYIVKTMNDVDHAKRRYDLVKSYQDRPTEYRTFIAETGTIKPDLVHKTETGIWFDGVDHEPIKNEYNDQYEFYHVSDKKWVVYYSVAKSFRYVTAWTNLQYSGENLPKSVIRDIIGVLTIDAEDDLLQGVIDLPNDPMLTDNKIVAETVFGKETARKVHAM